jgi:two-component system NtrC family sensor kinase
MANGARGTVVIVDDDPLVRESLYLTLIQCDYIVHQSDNGGDALRLIAEVSADIVVTDVNMPVVCGLELLEKTRALEPDLPVILLTGHANLDIAIAAIKRGAYDLILKPYDIHQILNSIDRGIDHRRLKNIERNYRAELERSVEERTRELVSAHERMIQGEKLASIGQLAAGVAHEINNPVGFIGSNLHSLGKYVERLTDFVGTLSDLITSSCSPDVLEKLHQERRRAKLDFILGDIQQLIGESHEGTERIRNIVHSLKSFSHSDNAESVPANLNEGLESTLNIVWNEIKYVATVEKDLLPLPLTRCYPQKLNQVFMNLLVNAGHAIKEQGTITIRTWHSDGAVFISIADSGCGIPQENLSRVFEPFFTTKGVGKGTGLGLSISYDIVKMHNGEITVQSELGKGTTFTVRIPVLD